MQTLVITKKYAVKIQVKIKAKKNIKNNGCFIQEEMECRIPSLKEEKENCFITRDIESLFIEGTDNVVYLSKR